MEEVKSLVSTTPVLLLTVSLLFAYFLLMWIFDKKHNNFPPGPRGWRDNLTFLKASMDGTLKEKVSEWAEKYGELTFVDCLGTRMLFLNTSRVARKIMASDEYKFKVADRKQTATTRLGFNSKDLMFTENDAIQKKKRRLFGQVMGVFGDGTDKLENAVQRETDKLLKTLALHDGEDYDMSFDLSQSLMNILYLLLLGESPPDPTGPAILEEWDTMFNKLLEPGHDYILTHFPLFAKLFTKIQTMVGRLQRATKAIVKLFYVTPKDTHVPGSPRGIADLLLDQAKKPGFEWMEEDLEHTVSFMLAIFWAAHLSTKSLLLGAMLCLVNYPDIAKKIQKEIDDVLDDRPPTVEDKADMPYTSATILELLRLITLVPLSGLRFIRDDISFEGMTIPKGTLIMASQWFIHHDERVWQDPWTPKPERFLSNTEQLLPPEDPVRKNIIPFGAGIRSCLGESFAQNRVFLIMTSILQKFDLHPPANEELRPADFTTNLDSAKGFVRQIPQFKCRLQRRRK